MINAILACPKPTYFPRYTRETLGLDAGGADLIAFLFDKARSNLPIMHSNLGLVSQATARAIKRRCTVGTGVVFGFFISDLAGASLQRFVVVGLP